MKSTQNEYVLLMSSS